MSNEASAKHPKKGKNKLSVELTSTYTRIESGKWGIQVTPCMMAQVIFETRGKGVN